MTFEGTFITVFDLKKEIILANNLVSSASDFDLLILDPTSEQGKSIYSHFTFVDLFVEYKDDNHQIPRSTSVLAKRLPAVRPGKGKAAQYVAGIQPEISRPDSSAGNSANQWQRGTMSMRFDGKEEREDPQPVNNS